MSEAPSLETTLASRFFRSKRHPRRPSRSTVLSVMGMACGVASLITVLSIMGGFERSLRSRMLQVQPHVSFKIAKLAPDDLISLTKNIETWAEQSSTHVSLSVVAEGSALATNGSRVAPIRVQGVDFKRWTRLESFVRQGHLPEPEEAPGLVLGQELAELLLVAPGDTLTLINPFERASPFIPLPMSRSFTVSAIVRTGVFEADQRFLWTEVETVNDFFAFAPTSQQIALWFEPPIPSASVVSHLKTISSPEHIQIWEDANRTLFQSMKLEQRAMFILLLCVIAVAALNIAILLTMTVNEKRSAMGMLLTLGMTPPRLMKVFAKQGIRIGLWGTSIGALIGVTACLLLKHFPLIELPDVYYDKTLPISLRTENVVLICVSTLVISWLASFLPAKKAARLHPVEALRSGR